MQTNQRVIEITGAPAQTWGNVLIPSAGTITVKISGDTLQATVKTGLEKKESWTRIQNIDSIEILEAPIYALLIFGGFLILLGLGILASSFIFGSLFIIGGAAIIVLTIKHKRRYLAFYSYRHTLAIFMIKSPDNYQQFAMNVLALARHLNTPANTPTRQPQSQTR